jgi:membrane protein YdbS with pleckstrin-like domain
VTERPTPEPTKALAPEARSMFTVEVLGGAVPAVAATVVLAAIFLDTAPAIAIGVVAVVLAVVAAIVIPPIRLAMFRYEVREEEIDLRHGIVVQQRTLVPMVRVQHVDTRRTLLSRFFGLAAVVFHTAAGANEIPALREADAAAIRDRIADLARTPEVL